MVENAEDIKKRIVIIVAVTFGVLMGGLRFFWIKEEIFSSLYWMLAGGALVPIAVKDYEYHIIPNKYLLWVIRFLAVIMLVHMIHKKEYILAIIGTKLIGMLIGSVVFLVAMLISPKSIGAGDVKLYGVLGMILGANVIYSVMFYALLLAAIHSLYLLISKKKGKYDELPLAPYTLIGYILAFIL